AFPYPTRAAPAATRSTRCATACSPNWAYLNPVDPVLEVGASFRAWRRTVAVDVQRSAWAIGERAYPSPLQGRGGRSGSCPSQLRLAGKTSKPAYLSPEGERAI